MNCFIFLRGGGGGGGGVEGCHEFQDFIFKFCPFLRPLLNPFCP